MKTTTSKAMETIMNIVVTKTMAKHLEDRLLKITNAMEVHLEDNMFYIIHDYEATENYYGSILFTPIGGKITLAKGLDMIIKDIMGKPKIVTPSMGDVLSKLSHADYNKSMQCIALLGYNKSSKDIRKKCYKTLYKIAGKYHWEPKCFIEIMAETYGDMMDKLLIIRTIRGVVNTASLLSIYKY